MGFDPDKYLAEKKKSFDPDAYLQQKEGGEVEEESFLSKAGDAVMGGLEAVESRTAAPARSAVSAALEGENPISAFQEQYAEPSSQAPAGTHIAEQMGFSSEKPEGVYRPVHPKTGESLGEGFSPAEYAGFGVDVLVDPLNLVPAVASSRLAKKIARGTSATLRNVAEKQAFKALAISAKTSGDFEALNPTIVGKIIIEQDLAKHLNNPVKLKKALAGERTSKVLETLDDGIDPLDVMVDVKEGGKIADLSNDLRANIDRISPKAHRINTNKIVDGLHERKRAAMMEMSGETEDLAALARYEKTLKGLIGKTSKPLTLAEAQKLKQKIGMRLKTKDFLAPADQAMALKKEAYIDAYRALKQSIEDSAMGNTLRITEGGRELTVDAGHYIKFQNQRIKTLVDIEKSLKGKDLANIKRDDLLQSIVRSAGGAVAGAMSAMTVGFDPLYGAAIGSGAIGGLKAGAAMSRRIPSMMARRSSQLQAVPEILRKGSMAAPLMDNIAPMDPATREPQSLPEQLIRTPIPRNSDWISANSDFVLAKVAQMRPEAYDSINDIISHNPEKLESLMPLLVEMIPEMFEYDKYNRVNGKITSPLDRMKADKDTVQRDDISNTEKIMIIDRLNKTGEFE